MSEPVSLIAAFVAFQTEVKNPPLNKTNPHFRSEYAALASILSMVRPLLAKHGLAIQQLPGQQVTPDGRHEVFVQTVLMHGESGETVASTISSFHASPPKIQQVGADLTYLRRYSITALLCIAGDSDADGNDVEAPAKKTRKRKPRKAPPAAALPSEEARAAAGAAGKAGVGHDPSWQGDRKLTAVLLQECDHPWTIDIASQFAEDHGMRRLSGMTQEQRSQFLDRLRHPKPPEGIDGWWNRRKMPPVDDGPF